MSNTIQINGTGGIIEGNLGTANVNVNLDSVLEFDGVNDKITVSDHSSLDIVGDITLSAWVKITMGESDFKTIISKSPALNNALTPWQLRIDDSDKVEFVTGDGSNTNRQSSTNAIKEGWNHIAVTVDENGATSVCKYFINGVLDRTISSGWVDYSGYTNNDDLLVGVLGTGYFHDGYLADVRIYNAVVSDADVAILASRINGDPSLTTAGTTNLQGWWKLNNNSVTDSSPNSNNGTASGPTERFDQFHVDVYDNSTTTDGTFTVTQGKVEGKALSAADFDGSTDYFSQTDSAFNYTNNFTLAAWIRPDSVSTQLVVLSRGGTDNASSQYTFGINSQQIRLTKEGVDNLDSGTNVLVADKWNHIAVTISSTDGVTFYHNGVNVGTNANTTNCNASSGGFYVGRRWNGDYDFDGEIKEIKIFDYVKSADQVASLYSNTYPQTPEHYFKFDEGSGNANNLGTSGIGVLSEVGSCGRVNGTLDLDGTLTIAANGTLSMPRGDLRMSKTGVYPTFDINCTNVATQFIHNNGRFQTDAAGDFQLTANGAAFYKIITNCSSSGNLELQESMTIEKEVVNGSGDPIQLTGGQTYTFGTATQSADINEVLRASNGSGTVTVQGASSLYPVNISQYDDMARELNLNLANVNVTTAVNFNRDKTVTLTGDCEFDAVTVSSGDTLDLNGQRAEVSGILTIADGGTMNTTNGGLLVCGSNLIASGAIEDIDGTPLNVIVSSGTGHRYNLGQSGGGGPWCENLLVNGNVTHNTGNIGNASSAHAPKNIIVGNGTFTQSGGTTTMLDITVATGGTFTPSQTDTTVTCEGDFTTSGGLLGASCLSFTSDKLGNSGQQDYAQVDDHADLDFASSRNALTLECWFKVDHNDTVDYLFDRRDGQDVFYLHVDPSNVLKGRIYTNGTTSELTGTTVVNDQKWHHCALVYDGDTGKHSLYVDGKLDVQETGSGGIYASASNIQFGARFQFNDAHFLDGEMDEIRMFAAAKTAAQIRADMFKAEGTALTHFNSLADASTDGLIGRWSCNEGTGSSLVSTGNTDVNAVIKDYNSGSPQTLTAGAWAGAGTFNISSSPTLIMSSDGAAINLYANTTDIHNLTINGNTTVNAIHPSGTNAFKLFGGLTVDTNKTLTFTGQIGLYNSGETFTFNTPATNVVNVGSFGIKESGTFDIPEVTMAKLFLDTSGGTVNATGNHTFTTELETQSGGVYKSNGYNVIAKLIDNAAGTLNIEKNSSLIFSDVSGAGFSSSAGTLNCKGAAAASFDGTDDKMEDTSNPLPGSGPFTFTMFFRTSKTGIRQGLVDFTESSARGMLDVMDNDKLLLYLGSSNYRYWDAITSYLDGEWHHMSLYVPGYAQADIASITVHIDGNLINPSGTLSSGVAQQPVMADLKLGCGYSGNNAWDGDLADARIFEKALTADNLTTLRSVNPSKANATNYSDANNDIGATHWWKLNESNFPTDNAADSVGSIALSVTGAVSNRITITSSAGGNPSNYWNFHDHSMAQTVHYTTLEKFHRYESGSGAIEYDNNTMQTSVSGYYNWTIEGSATINSFTNNTINVTGNYGFQCNQTHTAFDNITVTSSGDYSVISTGGRLEFSNSNFSIDNVNLSTSSSHVISSAHNDTENLYEICAGSGGLTYSAISNKPDIPNGVLRQRTGLFLFNSDNKEFNTLNVFSGATIRVADNKDMYLTVFDNDGTWDQSTSGYTTGEIHVGDFTPFDSGDIIDETDFVDTGFHDTTHYLEMDL